MFPINTVSDEARNPKSNSEALFASPDGLPDNAFQGQPLALRHVRQLANSEAFASHRGTPLTAFVTIHFRLSPSFKPEAWASFQTALFDRMSRWLLRQGLPVAFLWTREDGPRKGPHTHLLLHLPRHLWGAFERFMLASGGFQSDDATSKAIVITGGRWGMLVETMRAGALRYCLKSFSAADSTLAALGIRHVPTRPVMLKRCGASTTIAQKARREAGWIELKSIPELHAQLNPANDNRKDARHVA